MKKIFFALSILFFGADLSAQTEKQVNPPSVEASYATGNDALMKYIQTNLKYPKNKKIDGKVYVEFQILTDGSIADVKVLKGIDADFDKSATDVVSKMPKWTPAKDAKGNPVISKMVLPISFKK